MRRQTPILILLACLGYACLNPQLARCAIEERGTLRSIEQLASLTNAQAALALPVEVEATVTFLQPEDESLFIQQGDFGTYVNFSKDLGLLPGDRIVVRGVTDASFRPQVTASSVQFLAHGKLPTPIPARFEELIQSRLDSRYITISGHVLAAALDQEAPEPGMRIQIKVVDGIVEARIAHPDSLRAGDLLDADVRITGVAGGKFDSRMQMAGVWIDMNTAADLVIEHRAVVNPWNLPSVSMDQVIYSYRTSNESQRVRITGTLTYYEPGSLAVIEQGGQAMLVETDTTLPIHPGDGIEATGFPEIQDENVRLAHGQLRQLAQASHVQAGTIGWESASAGKFSYSLVAMEGEVVEIVQDSRVDLVILRTEGHLFSATLRHNSLGAGFADGFSSASLKNKISVGSRVRVTGVCFVDAGNHWRDRMWFDLRMRSLNDIAVLQRPSWWTVQRLAYVVTVLIAVILVVVAWVWLLRKRVRQQTEVLARKSVEEAIRERKLARQEQQRSHVLELINSTEPLQEVLREIRSMVSSRLDGASCWFELNGDAGVTPDLERPAGPAVVFQELYAPDGTSLGLLLATPLLHASPDVDIYAALSAGAKLAELAIDTRRLYSDLQHRSEHDLLTDIPNRFLMEKELDRLMLKASREGAIFGLIYVDLDHFKEVNDRYGHRTGDLYLQEVTRRMKLQLRNLDVLARIGGDEFIALVPILRSQADAEEIATRLEHCFDEPFEIEGLKIYGSASIGLAVYPQDGTTKEALQRSADAAMYAHKEGKRHQERLVAAMQKMNEKEFGEKLGQ